MLRPHLARGSTAKVDDGRHVSRLALPSQPAPQRRLSDLEEQRNLRLGATANTVRRHRPLPKLNRKRLAHTEPPERLITRSEVPIKLPGERNEM
jgi:hypothetical protein